MEINRIDDWIVVRLSAADEQIELANAVWTALEQASIYRVILKLDQLNVLRSRLVGDLVRIYKLVQEKQGAIRLCGLSDSNQMVLRMNRLDGRLPHYPDLQAAMSDPVPSA